MIDHLRPSEVAFVADVPVRDVNRVFDEQLLPVPLSTATAANERRISAHLCPLVHFYFHTDWLTPLARVKIISWSWDSIGPDYFQKLVTDWSVKHITPHLREMNHLIWTDTNLDIWMEAKTTPLKTHNFDKLLMKKLRRLHYEDHRFKVNLAIDVIFVSDRLRKLQDANAVVVIDPDVLRGAPVLRDTRIPVHDVAASAAAGISQAEILSAYPQLDPTLIDLAVIWSAANPPRGRPRKDADPQHQSIAKGTLKRRRDP